LFALLVDFRATYFGNCEVEEWGLTPGKKIQLLFNSNCRQEEDIDRRHISSVGGVEGGREPVGVTSGEGIEWSPESQRQQDHRIILVSNAQQPARSFTYVALAPGTSNNAVCLDSGEWPKGFSYRLSGRSTTNHFPFTVTDWELHAQLFLPESQAGREAPAPDLSSWRATSRQMLLGWHYMAFYSNAYAMNQPVSGQPRIYCWR